MTTVQPVHAGRYMTIAYVLCVVMLAIPGPALRAQHPEMPVPVRIQASLLPRVLAFERTLSSRTGDTLHLAVLYQRNHRLSLRTYDELSELLRSTRDWQALGRPVHVFGIDLSSDADATRGLQRHQPHVVYVAPLRAVDISMIGRACTQLRCLSVTGVPAYLLQGLAVGFDVHGDGPRVLIHRDAARDCGAEFNARLLRIAKVY